MPWMNYAQLRNHIRRSGINPAHVNVYVTGRDLNRLLLRPVPRQPLDIDLADEDIDPEEYEPDETD